MAMNHRYDERRFDLWLPRLCRRDARRRSTTLTWCALRWTTTGLGREQRLTVGQYGSWMEAEEHLHEVEDGLAENGLAALGEDAQRLREQPFEEEVFYMTAVYPPEAEGSDRAAAHCWPSARGVSPPRHWRWGSVNWLRAWWSVLTAPSLKKGWQSG